MAEVGFWDSSGKQVQYETRASGSCSEIIFLLGCAKKSCAQMNIVTAYCNVITEFCKTDIKVTYSRKIEIKFIG